MKNSVHPITLAGEHCTLVPLSQEHHDALSEAAADGELSRLDGILRNHMIMPNGTLRDTYVYSIIASEWPTIKAHLEFLKHA